MGNFFTDVIQKDPRYTSPEICNDLTLLHPVMRLKVAAVLADAAAEGHSLMVFETFRSEARQQELFKQGVTKLQKVGVHNFGLAVDIPIKLSNGDPSWDSQFLFLQGIAKKHQLIWGGDWGTPGIRHDFVDSDHLQWCSIAHQAALFNGSWYPSDIYDPYPG